MNTMVSARASLLAVLIIASGALAHAAPAAAQGEDAWYKPGLEKLGFQVFPKPVALDDFTVKRLAGGQDSLGGSAGKIVLLNFWATWCPPCREEMPAIESLWTALKGKSFTVFGVSVGEKEGTVKDFIAKNKYSYPIHLDPTGALGSAFGARSIPTTYVIDKGGKAIAGKVGGAAYGSPEAIALFSELAAR